MFHLMMVGIIPCQSPHSELSFISQVRIYLPSLIRNHQIIVNISFPIDSQFPIWVNESILPILHICVGFTNAVSHHYSYCPAQVHHVLTNSKKAGDLNFYF